MQTNENNTVLARLPNESVKAFEAFTVYLGMGGSRSLEAVGQRLGKSKALMERWSKRHNWVARVAAYMSEMVAMKQKLKEEFLREIALAEAERDAAQSESEWKARCRALRLANETMDRWEKNPDKYGTLEGIARLLELSSVLGRRSRGMPLQVKEEPKQLENKGPTISLEFRMALEKIYGQPVPAKFIDVEEVPAISPQLTEGK
jgi:hypothetical protein